MDEQQEQEQEITEPVDACDAWDDASQSDMFSADMEEYRS